MTAVSSCSACNGTTSKLRLIRPLLLLFAIGGAAEASAQSSPGKFELTPYGGYRFGGTFEDIDTEIEVELDDAASFGLIMNFRESGNTQWEVIYSQQNTTADVSDLALPQTELDLRLQNLQFGGTYIGEFMDRGERVRPYLAATIGGTHIEPDEPTLDSDTFWSFSIGGGLQLAPTNRVGLRLEARAWGTLIDSNTSLFCSSGPQGGLCAIRIDGRMLWQFETFAGVVFRF